MKSVLKKCLLSLPLSLSLLASLITPAAIAKDNLFKLDTGIANVFLLQGPRPILVDTSTPGHEAEIEAWLHKHQVEAKNLALIILTHGHGDHAGGAAWFAQKYQVPVMVGRGDLSMFRAGHTESVQPTSLLAGMLAIFVPQDYQGFEPTNIVDQEISLKAYGFNARVIPLSGGHTPGSLAVILDDTHEALVGDLLRGALFMPGFAEEHFFLDDRQIARWQLWELIHDQGVKLIHPSHFDSFTADEVMTRFFPEDHFAWP